MPDTQKNFKVGDLVEWTYTTAGGGQKTQTGTVISVIKPNQYPFMFNKDGEYVLPDQQVIPFSKTRYGGGKYRPIESYVVSINDGEAYYWPRVKSLRMVNEAKYVLRDNFGYFLGAATEPDSTNNHVVDDIDKALMMCLSDAQAAHQKRDDPQHWSIFETETGLRLSQYVPPRTEHSHRKKAHP